MHTDGVDRLSLTLGCHTIVRHCGHHGWGILRAKELGPFAKLIWVTPNLNLYPKLQTWYSCTGALGPSTRDPTLEGFSNYSVPIILPI